MTSEDCLSQLSQLLQEHLAALSNLRDALGRERTALEQGDFEALHGAATDKQTAAENLERLEIERRDLVRLQGFDQEDMAGLIARCDASGQLASHWAELRQQATQCRSMNEANGIIVNVRSRQLRTAIEMLRGGTGEAHSYGPSGETTPTNPTRAIGTV